jgi:hypothetical protein
VDLVAAALGGHVDHTAADAAELRTVDILLDGNLGDRIGTER